MSAFCGDDVALLRRDRADSVHYSAIGGNVDAGEDFRDAVVRELEEELGLKDRAGRTAPELIGMADARVTRPGSIASAQSARRPCESRPTTASLMRSTWSPSRYCSG
ncbi:NUDIX hydrolase [Kitasatospora sp. NBC_01302]|uniref:NUDIX hydrolase n=1 Tax=Kitasatospora sp. NBC_01302 TaxID=2903575 RepID=UPI003FA3CFF6